MALLDTDLFLVERGGTEYQMNANRLKAFLQANFIAADIAARDALSIETGDEVYVVDATADATVSSGGAKYIYDGAAFIKTAEDESFDITIAPTNLAYTPSPTNGLVTSSTGADATIPAVTLSNAGLATPSMLLQSHDAISSGGSPSTNPVVVDETAQQISFSISQLSPLP